MQREGVAALRGSRAAVSAGGDQPKRNAKSSSRIVQPAYRLRPLRLRLPSRLLRRSLLVAPARPRGRPRPLDSLSGRTHNPG